MLSCSNEEAKTSRAKGTELKHSEGAKMLKSVTNRREAQRSDRQRGEMMSLVLHERLDKSSKTFTAAPYKTNRNIIIDITKRKPQRELNISTNIKGRIEKLRCRNVAEDFDSGIISMDGNVKGEVGQKMCRCGIKIIKIGL